MIHSIPVLTKQFPLTHNCQVESYTENFNLRSCSQKLISIKTTRCRGQCHSEDFLVYDWQTTPTYRHQRHIHCCSPNKTHSYETQILCDNKQIQTIKYEIVTQCQCKFCSDKCFE